MRIRIFQILLSVIFTLRLFAQTEPQYKYESWKTDQGLPQNTVQTILQYSGYLWIGTKEGLARFDGINFVTFDRHNTPQFLSHQIRGIKTTSRNGLWISTPNGLLQYDGDFTVFTDKNGLSSNNISSVYEDSKGGIWVATVNGLNKFKLGKDGMFANYSTANGLSHNSIQAILEDKEKNLWIGTADGLNRFKDEKFTSFTRADGLAGNNINTIFQSSKGELWIGTTEGVSSFSNGKFSTYTNKNGLADNDVEVIAEDKSGRVWLGTPNGLTQFYEGKFSSFTTKNGLPGNRIGQIFETREGLLWVGTSNGLAKFVDGKFQTYNGGEGIANTSILSIFEDREGSLWIGTEVNGLTQLKTKKITTYTMREGLSANLIRSISGGKKGEVWIGTKEGGLNLLSDNQLKNFPAKQSLASTDILAITNDQQDNLWLGTPAGLKRIQGGKITNYSMKDGLSDDYVRSLFVDRAGVLWIGTRRGLNQFKDGKFTPYTTMDGLASDLVGAICEDKTGSLWIGTLNGLSQFKDEKFTNYNLASGLSNEVIISLYSDNDGALWIGTLGGGLNRFKDGKFSHFTTKEGFPDDSIYHILEDDRGRLWMSSNKGIIRATKEELENFSDSQQKLKKVFLYTTADGMETNECSGGGHPAGWKSEDGKLWFATIKGVAMIDPANLKLNTMPAPVAIEKIIIDQETFRANERAVLEPGKSRFDFYFTALSFLAPQKNLFKYKLEGFDQDWIEAGTRRIASYTNIPAGDYEFKVMAANNDGIWGEGSTLFTFYVKPHYYQTWWFYLFCLAGILAAIWYWYRVRVKIMERQFSAVLSERNRLAREIHDTLAQGLAGISLQLELVARMLSIKPESAKAPLDQARKLVRNNLDEARRSVWDLRSQALENNDLPAAVNESAKQLTANTSTQVQVKVGGTYRQLSRLIEDNLLRITQEAITNAIKHAQADLIRVELNYEPKNLRLTVNDNGRGFDDKIQHDKHYGLIGMKERATQIGGNVTVNSQVNQGTEITVQVPLAM